MGNKKNKKKNKKKNNKQNDEMKKAQTNQVNQTNQFCNKLAVNLGDAQVEDQELDNQGQDIKTGSDANFSNNVKEENENQFEQGQQNQQENNNFQQKIDYQQDENKSGSNKLMNTQQVQQSTVEDNAQKQELNNDSNQELASQEPYQNQQSNYQYNEKQNHADSDFELKQVNQTCDQNPGQQLQDYDPQEEQFQNQVIYNNQQVDIEQTQKIENLDIVQQEEEFSQQKTQQIQSSQQNESQYKKQQLKSEQSSALSQEQNSMKYQSENQKFRQQDNGQNFNDDHEIQEPLKLVNLNLNQVEDVDLKIECDQRFEEIQEIPNNQQEKVEEVIFENQIMNDHDFQHHNQDFQIQQEFEDSKNNELISQINQQNNDQFDPVEQNNINNDPQIPQTVKMEQVAEKQNESSERLQKVVENIKKIQSNSSSADKYIEPQYKFYIQYPQGKTELQQNYSIKNMGVRKDLAKICNSIQKVRGDGNCFYYAFGYQYLNHILFSFSDEEFNNFINRIQNEFKLQFRVQTKKEFSINDEETEKLLREEFLYQLKNLRAIQSVEDRKDGLFEKFREFEIEKSGQGCFCPLATLFCRNLSNHLLDQSPEKQLVFDRMNLIIWEEECDNNEIVIANLAEQLKMHIKLLFFKDNDFTLREYGVGNQYEIILLIHPGHYNIGIKQAI